MPAFPKGDLRASWEPAARRTYASAMGSAGPLG